MFWNKFEWAKAFIATLAIVSAIWLLSPARSQPTFTGPVMTTVAAGVTATLAVVGVNPSRRSFTICNGHATQSVTFTFGAVTPVSVTTGQTLPGGSLAQSCYTPPGAVLGGVGAQINVIASGAATPVSIIEY